MSAKGRLGETSGQVKPEQENILRMKGLRIKRETECKAIIRGSSGHIQHCKSKLLVIIVPERREIYIL